MRYFKDTDNNPYVFEDNVTEAIIKKVEATHNAELTEITRQEYEALIAPTLEELKERKKQEIESAYKQAIQEPIAVFISGNEHTFQADEKSQDILTKVITSAPDGFSTNWLDIDNNPVSVTLADLKLIAQSILSRGQQEFVKKMQLKTRVDAATSEEELDAIK